MRDGGKPDSILFLSEFPLLFLSVTIREIRLQSVSGAKGKGEKNEMLDRKKDKGAFYNIRRETY